MCDESQKVTSEWRLFLDTIFIYLTVLFKTFRLEEEKKNDFVSKFWSQSYQPLIFSFLKFLFLSLAILKYRQHFLMLQTLKLNNEKWKKIFVLRRKKFGRIDASSRSFLCNKITSNILI